MSDGQEKKYEIVKTDWIELIDDEHIKHRLFRIRAIKDFDDVKSGDYGGYIESEDNLNQYDTSWLYSDAVRISKNTRAWGNARVYSNGKLYNSAEVRDNGVVCGNAKVYEDALIAGNAKVHGNSYIHGISKLYDNVNVSGDLVNIYGNTILRDRVVIDGEVTICDTVSISSDVNITGSNITIDGEVVIDEPTNISSDALIQSNDDFISVNNIGSRRDVLTAWLSADKVIMVNTGCFTNTYDEFLAAVNDVHSTNQFGIEYRNFAEAIKNRFMGNEPSQGGSGTTPSPDEDYSDKEIMDAIDDIWDEDGYTPSDNQTTT